MRTPTRCGWATGDADYAAYHDSEWGVPLHDERRLFEMLILEGAQAGLSWLTILRKRDNYRAAFDAFDAEAIARYGDRDRERLLADAGIVRNRLKIDATIANAKATLALREERGGLDAYLWDFVDGTPLQNAWHDLGEVPASTPLSESISKDLKRRGFRFVGPTIVYAYMQSIGMVNDHVTDCFRHAELV
ncbi:MAG: DNA-3-methyladenine glycosylase I [Alphaproteobacteria bacterium]|nr:DNA-3-methyladenine glycosylase I [Alphaproteobacteria bacterium]